MQFNEWSVLFVFSNFFLNEMKWKSMKNQIWKVHWMAFPQAIKLGRRLSTSATCDNFFFLSRFFVVFLLFFLFLFCFGFCSFSFFLVLSFCFMGALLSGVHESSVQFIESLCAFFGWPFEGPVLKKGRELFWDDDLWEWWSVLLIVAFELGCCLNPPSIFIPNTR